MSTMRETRSYYDSLLLLNRPSRTQKSRSQARESRPLSPATPETYSRGSDSSSDDQDAKRKHLMDRLKWHCAGMAKSPPVPLDVSSKGGSIEPHRKRQRTAESTEPSTSGKSCTSDTDEQTTPSLRLVLLVANLIPITNNTRRKRNSNTREKQPREVILFIPEYIIRQIPRYNEELDEEMQDVEDEGQTFEISDPIARHQVALVRAIEYVGGALLPPVDASAPNVQQTLAELLAVYDVSIGLEIKDLEEKILNHIESCPDMPTETFLTFARTVYAGDENSDVAEHATNSSIGKLIKRKLAVLLPQLLQDGTVRSIKAEGGILSNKLLEVMIDHYSGKQGIKIED